MRRRARAADHAERRRRRADRPAAGPPQIGHDRRRAPARRQVGIADERRAGAGQVLDEHRHRGAAALLLLGGGRVGVERGQHTGRHQRQRRQTDAGERERDEQLNQGRPALCGGGVRRAALDSARRASWPRVHQHARGAGPGGACAGRALRLGNGAHGEDRRRHRAAGHGRRVPAHAQRPPPGPATGRPAASRYSTHPVTSLSRQAALDGGTPRAANSVRPASASCTATLRCRARTTTSVVRSASPAIASTPVAMMPRAMTASATENPKSESPSRVRTVPPPPPRGGDQESKPRSDGAGAARPDNRARFA